MPARVVSVYQQPCPSCPFTAVAASLLGSTEALVDHVEYVLALQTHATAAMIAQFPALPLQGHA